LKKPRVRRYSRRGGIIQKRERNRRFKNCWGDAVPRENGRKDNTTHENRRPGKSSVDGDSEEQRDPCGSGGESSRGGT